MGAEDNHRRGSVLRWIPNLTNVFVSLTRSKKDCLGARFAPSLASLADLTP